MRRFIFGVALLLAGLLCLTQAQSQLLGVLKGHSGPPPGYQGPGDIVPGALWFGGLYAYNVAYATGSNPAADVCDAATFTVCTTVNILATGYFDDATAAALPQCASACLISKLYDQTGNGHHLFSDGGVSTTAPALTFAALSGRAVMTFNGTFNRFITPAAHSVQPTQPLTTYMVYKGAGSLVYWEGPSNTGIIQVSPSSSPDGCGTYAGVGGIGATAASSGVWHACTAVFNNLSTFVAIDSVVGTPGDTGSSNTGDFFYIGAGYPGGTSQFFAGPVYGAIVYGSALTSGQATSLNVNAHTIGGF